MQDPFDDTEGLRAWGHEGARTEAGGQVDAPADAGEPMARPVDTADGGVRDVLRGHGLRYSRPREAILAYMAEAPRHLSAEALYQALRERGEDLSLSTVYLNLGVLVEAGLLREFKGANGESLYDSSVEPHYHLICRDTGEVVDVPLPTVEGVPLPAYLRAYVERVTGWQLEEAHLSLRGRRRKRAASERN